MDTSGSAEVSINQSNNPKTQPQQLVEPFFQLKSAPSLPSEIWEQIFRLATEYTGEFEVTPSDWRQGMVSHHKEEDSASEWVASLPTRRSIVLVSKSWHAIGIPILYSSFLTYRYLLKNSDSILRFTTTCITKPNLSAFVRKLTLSEPRPLPNRVTLISACSQLVVLRTLITDNEGSMDLPTTLHHLSLAFRSSPSHPDFLTIINQLIFPLHHLEMLEIHMAYDSPQSGFLETLHSPQLRRLKLSIFYATRGLPPLRLFNSPPSFPKLSSVTYLLTAVTKQTSIADPTFTNLFKDRDIDSVTLSSSFLWSSSPGFTPVHLRGVRHIIFQLKQSELSFLDNIPNSIHSLDSLISITIIVAKALKWQALGENTNLLFVLSSIPKLSELSLCLTEEWTQDELVWMLNWVTQNQIDKIRWKIHSNGSQKDASEEIQKKIEELEDGLVSVRF